METAQDYKRLKPGWNCVELLPSAVKRLESDALLHSCMPFFLRCQQEQKNKIGD
jgi:hypothetical protein